MPWREQYANVNAGSLHGPGIDGHGAIHQGDALAHAGETEPLAVDRGICIKAFSRITDDQMNLTGVFVQLHFNLPRPTMFDSVVHGLLQYAKQGKAQF